MPVRERERVLRVKRGDVPSVEDVVREISEVQADIENRLANERTPLPTDPDLEAVSAWSATAHRRHWNWT